MARLCAAAECLLQGPGAPQNCDYNPVTSSLASHLWVKPHPQMAWAPCSPSAASPPLHLFDKGYNLASAAFVGSLRSYEPTQRQRDTAQPRNDGSMSSRSAASCGTARSTSSRKSMPPHLTGETHSELTSGSKRIRPLSQPSPPSDLHGRACIDSCTPSARGRGRRWMGPLGGQE